MEYPKYPNSTRMEMIRVGAPPPREPAELPRTMATVGGGGAPPGELGNHSHREGGCAHPRGRRVTNPKGGLENSGRFQGGR